MIDVKVWMECIALLKVWFNTELTEPEEAFMLKSLSSKLNQEEFVVACQLLIENSPKGYPGRFPCVNDFVRAVKGSPESLGAKAWTGTLKLICAERQSDISPDIKRILQRVAPISSIANADPQQTYWYRKEFIEQYKQFIEHRDRNTTAKQITGRTIRQLSAGE